MWHSLRSSSCFRTVSALYRHASLVSNSYLQTRTFVNALLGSALGPCPLRSISQTKTIPYSASSIFKAVSDVSGYPAFLPFTISSNVTSRDEKGYPSQASLKVGYDKFGLEEIWESDVKCEPEKGIIHAQSSKTKSSDLFEVLETRWQILPAKSSNQQTYVQLDLNVKFRNPFYDRAFAQVEGRVVDMMITAFEKRVKELEASKR